MQHYVWYSGAFTNSSHVKKADADVFLADADRALDAMQRSRVAVPLPRDRFPAEIYLKQGAKRLPDIALPGGFWTVSAKLADILRRFELGRTALYRTRVLRADRTTPIEGEYFCLSLGERKDTILPAASPGLERPSLWEPTKSPDVWHVRFDVHDDDLAPSPAALGGSDLWVEERIRDNFFVSDALGQELKEAGLGRRLRLTRGRAAILGHALI